MANSSSMPRVKVWAFAVMMTLKPLSKTKRCHAEIAGRAEAMTKSE
jgi:hypothetical protein